jgi:hypothetical protein
MRFGSRTMANEYSRPPGRIGEAFGDAPARSEMRQHGGQFCTRMVSRCAGFLAWLAITADPALAQSPNPLLPRNLSPWGMFLNADIVVKAVMIGLAFASLVTWTVWLAKIVELNGKKRLARRRLKILESGGNLIDAVRACETNRDAVAQLILSKGRKLQDNQNSFTPRPSERICGQSWWP